MNSNTFNFQEALSYIECGEMVQLTLNAKTRRYYLKNGKIMCIPNLREDLEYAVKDFKIDAVLSNDWELVWN